MQSFDDTRIDSHSLRLFLAVFELNSVSAAAARFDVNQSTVSYGLDKLRAYFGDPLFVKAGRGITPTERTKQLVPKVRQLLADLEGLADTGQYDPAQDQTPLVIATNVTELLPEMAALRALICARAPLTQIKFLELGSRENLLSILENSKADVAISIRMAKDAPVLRRARLFEDAPVIFYDASQRGPIDTVEAYGTAHHVVLDFGGQKKSMVGQAIEDRGMYRHVALSAPNAYVMAEMMRGTRMIATMQERLAGSVFRGFAHCPPPVPLPRVTFDLTWHRRYDHTGRNLWLRTLIQELPRRAAAPTGALTAGTEGA